MYVLSESLVLPAILADFLQRQTPFMYTMKLTSATYSAFMNLLRAMKFGSLTLALFRLLETVGMRTGQWEGVIPNRTLMSLSRRFNPTEPVDEGLNNE